jgi:hypothetical protein
MDCKKIYINYLHTYPIIFCEISGSIQITSIRHASVKAGTIPMASERFSMLCSETEPVLPVYS